ncbi:GNAT superfamily N-acetyltransferase [Paenibacillus shirakamiensis]|uniref:GNAT superfamily N-acetyltransferase n=1 Tax=Paenibacillus shirakamiensis TaxID=1265935 RepID=A0ABS4JLG2_9BACL|nr:N-acetyltransferase [Paenibacillus shirakamiensis]MBP2002552.1 GNAT superfamily N-acetyltransferase [Paenibacillus shirakamiensis]
MEITQFIPDSDASWSRTHSTIMQFIRRYGGNRITNYAYQEVQRMTPELLANVGNAWTLATLKTEDGRRLAGIALTSDLGHRSSLVVVHPLYRGRRIGTKLLEAQLLTLGSIRCRVALDNISSLKMCFQAGLTARKLLLGPTGKPTLVLEYTQPLPAQSQPAHFV